MLTLAQKLDIAEGGRFCTERGESGHVDVVVYTPATTPGGRARLGVIRIDLGLVDPSADARRISLVWYPETGGTEQVLWRALRFLAGFGLSPTM